MEAIDTELEEMKRGATKLLEGAAEVWDIGFGIHREDWPNNPYYKAIKDIEKMSDAADIGALALNIVYSSVKLIRTIGAGVPQKEANHA